MTEEQANAIIELLTEINEKLPKKTSYDLDDLHIEISSVRSSVDEVVTEIRNLNIS